VARVEARAIAVEEEYSEAATTVSSKEAVVATCGCRGGGGGGGCGGSSEVGARRVARRDRAVKETQTPLRLGQLRWVFDPQTAVPNYVYGRQVAPL
jgi:hypothetical protein